METQSKLKSLAEKVTDLKDQINSEEATKTAFILPFINILGYDIFNPTEVVPEFTADIGLKKGEKVDYAIFQNGIPQIIIECKCWREDLNVHNSQLFRYFHVTKARFGLLTNGIQYRFYTDLEESNKMDEKPFFEFDITLLKDSTLTEIMKFHKSDFDVDKIFSNASSLKYTREIKKIFDQELNDPSEDFVRLFATKVYNGRLMEKILLQFKDLVQKAINQQISEKVNARLQSALHKEEEQQSQVQIELEEEVSKIVTTEEEMEGFRMVIAILRRKIDKERIASRDTQSYFGVLLDDNNRKPICRLHFNSNNKYLGLFDENKKETKYLLQDIDDIYNYEKEILETLEFYEK